MRIKWELSFLRREKHFTRNWWRRWVTLHARIIVRVIQRYKLHFTITFFLRSSSLAPLIHLLIQILFLDTQCGTFYLATDGSAGGLMRACFSRVTDSSSCAGKPFCCKLNAIHWDRERWRGREGERMKETRKKVQLFSFSPPQTINLQVASLSERVPLEEKRCARNSHLKDNWRMYHQMNLLHCSLSLFSSECVHYLIISLVRSLSLANPSSSLFVPFTLAERESWIWCGKRC